MNDAHAPAIRPATPGDIDIATGALSEAFHTYAWTRWSIPEQGYSRRLAELQGLYLRYALTEGVVLVDEQVDGVIALLPPTADSPSDEFQRRVALLHGARFPDLVRTVLPPAPQGYWTLATLGVRPACQGAGLGGSLVRAGLDVVAGSGHAGIALETSDERNVRLYERAGFVVVATTLIDGGPVVHSMVRHACEPASTQLTG